MQSGLAVARETNMERMASRFMVRAFGEEAGMRGIRLELEKRSECRLRKRFIVIWLARMGVTLKG
jgi:hypothetical protein